MSATWTGAVDAAALCVTALALAVGAVVVIRTRRLAPALACFMELLTGAGLLRLAASPTLTRALAAGGVLLVRRLAVLGLNGDPLAGLLPGLRRLVARPPRA